jgi:hypothetical protein
MSTYNNGPGNVPRLPKWVVDTLINSAGVSDFHPNGSQLNKLHALAHGVAEELLARLPAEQAAPSRDGRLDDMAALIRRLVLALRRSAPGNALSDQALDYLHRKGLQGSPLRQARGTDDDSSDAVDLASQPVLLLLDQALDAFEAAACKQTYDMRAGVAAVLGLAGLHPVRMQSDMESA